MMEANIDLKREHTEDSIYSYITVDEMAKRLSIARATAYQLTKISDFPCFYIGKRIIIPSQSFNEWAEKQARNKTELFGGEIK